MVVVEWFGGLVNLLVVFCFMFVFEILFLNLNKRGVVVWGRDMGMYVLIEVIRVECGWICMGVV